MCENLLTIVFCIILKNTHFSTYLLFYCTNADLQANRKKLNEKIA